LNDLHSRALAQILETAIKCRRGEINSAIYQHLGGIVYSGPFAGMALPSTVAWLDGDISPKLLGSYESELHALVSAAAGQPYQLLLNIGCAEGYYAIGFARLMPQTRIFAFDADENAQRICREAAMMNGVGNRVSIHGQCDAATLNAALAEEDRPFLWMDCEGAEMHLLSPAAVPRVSHCDFVVECHDMMDRSITATLQSRFAATHDLRIIEEGPRNPNAHPFLRTLGSLDRWLSICEFRPETMHWLVGMRRA
jgi:hypothetical protein